MNLREESSMDGINLPVETVIKLVDCLSGVKFSAKNAKQKGKGK